MRWAAIVFACVGCGSRGVDIRVAAMPGVEHVELFVAPAACQPGENAETCDRGIAWDGSGTKQAGAIFILDVDQSTAGIAADDGSFRFTLHTDADAPAKVKRLAFVGYGDAAGSAPIAAAWLTNVELPTGSAEEWRITLDPVEPVPTPQAPPAGDAQRLHVWTRGLATTSRCVVGEHWHEGTVEREFLVPPGDTDCDDIDEAKECDPYWWQAPGTRPPLANASCVTNLHATDELLAPACLVGGPACSEVGNTTEACVPVAPTHCASTAMCTDGCRANLRGCIETLAIATVKCKVPTTELGAPCPDADTVVMSFEELVAGSLTECQPPRFAAVSQPLAFDSQLTIDGVTLAVESSGSSNSCAPSVRWSGSHDAGLVAGLVAVPFNNGTTSVLGLLFEPVPSGCDQVIPTCTTYVPQTDDVLACGRALPVQ